MYSPLFLTNSDFDRLSTLYVRTSSAGRSGKSNTCNAGCLSYHIASKSASQVQTRSASLPFQPQKTWKDSKFSEMAVSDSFIDPDMAILLPSVSSKIPIFSWYMLTDGFSVTAIFISRIPCSIRFARTFSRFLSFIVFGRDISLLKARR